MILVINTADSEQVFVGLLQDGKWIAKKQFKAKARQAEKLLPAIEKLLKTKSYQLKTMKGIAVVSGPASFTALRIGVVTANTLAWSLKVPIIGIQLDEFSDLDILANQIESKLAKNNNQVIVQPFYGKEPNITLKK